VVQRESIRSADAALQAQIARWLDVDVEVIREAPLRRNRDDVSAWRDQLVNGFAKPQLADGFVVDCDANRSIATTLLRRTLNDDPGPTCGPRVVRWGRGELPETLEFLD
jgi:hypothetical protein